MSLQREVRAKLSGKRDPAQESEVMEWIESVLGEKVFASGPYEEILKDGQVICRLINKLKPNSVANINKTGGQFKMMENINNFMKAAEDYGVPKLDMFQTVDLYERKDIGSVTSCLKAVKRIAESK